MAVPAGARIGVFEITGTLGAGGWPKSIAPAIRSSIEVAIKVLPESFAPGTRIGQSSTRSAR